jgi:hypothetical protein
MGEEITPSGETLEKEMEKAYRLYQENIRRTGDLIYRLTKGAKDGTPEKELIRIAEEAAKRCCFSPEETGRGGDGNGQGTAV